MKSKIKNVVIFLSGLASGAAGMFFFMKNKWQKDFDAKREEMIQYYQNKQLEQKKEEPVVEEVPDTKEELNTMKSTIQKFNYAKVSDTSEKTLNTAPILNDAEYSTNPYEISPTEFGSQEMYGMVTLFLYDDGEVRTDKYELLDDEDIENYLGNMLEKLADLRDVDPELDAYYVRNDRLKTDYEILIEAGRYEAMKG